MLILKVLNFLVCFQKRRTLRRTLQKKEEQTKANSISKYPTPAKHVSMANANSLTVNLDSKNAKPVSSYYRRPSLLEATTKSDCLPPPLDYQPPSYSDIPARSGRTVTWHNPSHSPDHLV